MAPTSKDMAIAYFLWICFGAVGGHRYYLASYSAAALQTMLFVMVFFVGHGSSFFIWVLFVWWLIDAIVIPSLVDEINREYRRWLRNDSPRVGQATPYEISQLNDWNRISVTSSEQGDQAGAIVVGIKALALAEQLYGRQHAHVGVIKANLGEFYRLHGDLIQAHRMLVDAIAIKELSNNPLDAVVTMSNLVLVYMATEQYGDAEQVLARMQMQLARCKQDTPLYFQYLVTCYDQSGQLAVVQGNFAAAQQCFESGVALVGRLPEDNGGLKLRMIINTGHALVGLGQFQRAVEYYQRAAMLCRHERTNVSADIHASFARLGQALQRHGIDVDAPPVVTAPAADTAPLTVPLTSTAADYVVPTAEIIPYVPETPQAALAASRGYVPFGSVVDTQATLRSKLVLDKSSPDQP